MSEESQKQDRDTQSQLTPGEEAQLVESCVSGDSLAWNRFVDLYGPRLYVGIKYFMRSYRESLPEEDALNAYQEVFLDLCADDFRKLKTFRAGGRLATWLFTVARRTCLDYIRNMMRKKRKPLSLAEPEILDAGRSMGSQTDPLSAMENREAVLEAINSLDSRSRMLLVLFYFEDLSYEEIAKVMDIPETSISAMLKKARDSVARILNM